MRNFSQKAFYGFAGKIGISLLMAICFALFNSNISAQTVLVNYDFASATAGTPCTATPLTTATGVTSTFTTGGTGGGTCTTPAGTAVASPPAFVANSLNQAVSLTSFASGSTNYFQFQLSGVSSYQDYMLFFNARRSGTGPVNVDVQYSLDGTNFTTFTTIQPPSLSSFNSTTAFTVDLSTVAAIENQPTVYFRLLGRDGTGTTGTFVIDNFQVRATAVAANPTVNLTITPTTGAETGQTQFTATVTASAPVSGDQTVNFALTSGTAGTADFVSIPVSITILSGQTSGTATFNVFDDSLVEGTESATFTISNPTAGITLGTTTSATVNITDNDVPALPDLTISQSAPETVALGGSYTYTLTVTNTGADNLTNVDVNFAVPTGVTYVSAAGTCTSITPPPAPGTSGTVQFIGCSVPANSTADLTVIVTAPTMAQTITSAGTDVVVDPNGIIVESNETNNTAADVSTTILAAPTAAMVNVGGRVINAKGRGISGVLVTMTDGNGRNYSAYTDVSGFYLFEEVEVGQTVIFNVRAKRYNFAQATQIVSLTDETVNINFTGYESRRLEF